MKTMNHWLCLLCMLMTYCTSVQAQQKLKLSVVEFAEDPFDMSARDKQYKKTDGSGSLYAIIKVTTDNPNDNLTDYRFNFGQLRHESQLHDDALWVYVQKNAKQVTISRNGYTTISKYDLGMTIEAGKNYTLQLSAEEEKFRTQIVQFHVSPADAKAVVTVKSVRNENNSELFGTTDAEGNTSKSLPYGTYHYTVMAENYHPSEGRITLNDKANTLIENVTLRPNFGDVTFTVDAQADIYINNEKKGRRTWKGRLKAGDYQVECRQQNHRPTSQRITVMENDNRTFNLIAPQPITGTLAIVSTPVGADIDIDGKNYGTTPRNVDIIIGRHTVTLSKANYQQVQKSIDVLEERTTDVTATLSSMARMTIDSRPSGATLHIDGTAVGTTPYTADMASGDYRIRLTRYKYKPFERTVHLDVSKPHVSYNLSRRYYKRSYMYMQAGFQVGGFMAPTAAVGWYIRNVNIEAFAGYGLDSETVYGLSEEGFEPTRGSMNPQIIGGKIGYGVTIGNRWRLTPQVGYSVVSAEATDVAKICTGSINAALRMEFALRPHISIFVMPQYRSAMNQGDLFKTLAEESSAIKAWGSGSDVVAGISINF